MIDTTILLSFCYAPCCLCQFIVVERGFLLSHPLTIHLYVGPSMANLTSHISTPRLQIKQLPPPPLNHCVFIQHVAMQLHALKKSMSQNPWPVHSLVFLDDFEQMRQYLFLILQTNNDNPKLFIILILYKW